MLEMVCARCGKARLRHTGEVNRARKAGAPLYCSRECMAAAKRTDKKALGWHERRFEARPGAIETTCAECGKAMWLPPTKVGEYKRCGRECNRVWREREKRVVVIGEKRIPLERPCETCGKIFRPRPNLVRKGQGRYCSHKCQPSAHLSTPEALAHAQQRRRENQAAGLIEWKTGPDHHAWTGGKEAAAERQRAPEKVRQRAKALRAYRARNPHKIREWKQRRGKGKVMPRLPYGTIPRLGEMQRWKCAICRESVKGGYHLDHIMPIAKGGRHEPRNLQLLCQSCNVRKSAKDPIAYMQQIGRLL